MTTSVTIMSDIEDLQNKILQFKVIELQSLLRHANSVKYGRKQELQKRAFDILKQNPDIIRNKVLEIYQAGYEKYPFPSLPNNEVYTVQYFADAASYSSLKPVSVKSLTFTESPFFAVIGSLMDPVVLAPSNHYTNVAEVRHYSFDLTVDHANLLAQSRNKVLAHLKFCVSDMSKRKDTFPYGLSVEVNGKHCTLPNSSCENDQKQQKYFVDVSSFIKIAPMVTNRIKITWIREPIVYGATVHLVTIKEPKELLADLVQNKMIPPSVTTAMVIQKLAPDPNGDDEIATTNLKASLICPLSKKRMTFPCRPASCVHLQCFDAQKFLLLNEQKEYFICPICHKSITFEELQIDSVFYEILSKTPKKCNEVEFHENGSWSTEFYKKNSKNGNKRHIEVVDIAESEDESVSVPSDTPSKKIRNQSPAEKSIAKKNSSPIAGCSSDGLRKEKTFAYVNVANPPPLPPACVNEFACPKVKEPLSGCNVPQRLNVVPFKTGRPHKSSSHSLKYPHINKTDAVILSSQTKHSSFAPTEHLLGSTSLKQKYASFNLEQHDMFSTAQQSPIDYSLSGSVKLPDNRSTSLKFSLTDNALFEKLPESHTKMPWMPPSFSSGRKVAADYLPTVDRVSSEKFPSIDKYISRKSPGSHSKTMWMPTSFSMNEKATLPKLPTVDMTISRKLPMNDKGVFQKIPGVNMDISPKLNNIKKSIPQNGRAINMGVLPKMPIDERSNVPKMHAIDMTVSSKMAQVFNGIPSKVNNAAVKNYAKFSSVDIKIPKKHSTPYSDDSITARIPSKVEGLVPLTSPLLQPSGLGSTLHHYPSMSAIPALIHSNSVGFAPTKMFLPSEPENSCLYPPFMQARCPTHVPFFPYNVPYYNQTLHFGSFFGNHVQGVPNMYSFLPSATAIFSQNLHDMNGDFLGQQAR